MSGTSTHGRELARLREKEAALRKELSRQQAEEAKALEDALKLVMSANKAASASSRNTYGRAVQRARKRAADANRKAGEISEKIAQNAQRQANKMSRLRAAERARQLLTDLGSNARQLNRIVSVALPDSRQRASKQLRVLYLTANPELDLLAEAEVRQVQQALRTARYRDRVEIQSRLATSFQELLDVLRDVRPQIVHFSELQGEETLRLDTEGWSNGGDDAIDFTAFARALAQIEQPPKLLMLNARAPLQAAAVVLPIVPVIVGLPDAMLETAAIVFSQQLYAALATGYSVGDALRRGKLKMTAVLLDEADALPTFIARGDVDVDSVVLMDAASDRS